jgi:glycosyltransferase involved in cell wall biosynthesis
VSGVVITHNEEKMIERCLSSLSWTREVIVVDALSTDRTAEIAAAMGARVFKRPWPGYAAQKSFGVAQATQPWVLNVDADEVVLRELADEIDALLDGDVEEAAFSVRIPLYFLGRELGHYGRAAQDPGHVRLFRKDQAGYDDSLVHELVVTDGRVGRLRNKIHHDSYPKPELRSYWRKINHYARLEAQVRASGPSAGGNRWVRAIGRLGWMLLVRKGLLDGPAAWVWIAGQAYQDWLASGTAAKLGRHGGAISGLA